jgi:hypothetical protein
MTGKSFPWQAAARTTRLAPPGSLKSLSSCFDFFFLLLLDWPRSIMSDPHALAAGADVTFERRAKSLAVVGADSVGAGFSFLAGEGSLFFVAVGSSTSMLSLTSFRAAAGWTLGFGTDLFDSCISSSDESSKMARRVTLDLSAVLRRREAKTSSSFSESLNAVTLFIDFSFSFSTRCFLARGNV